MTWNSNQISDQFKAKADSAERYIQSRRRDAETNPSYQHILDENLAEFYLYNSLWGKTFLESKESLIKHLQDLLNNPAQFNPTDAYDIDRFQAYFERSIQTLIKRVKE